MKKFTLFLLAIIGIANMVNAQRYLTPVFPNKPDVKEDQTYAINYTVLAVPVLKKTIPEALKCDIYTPNIAGGDKETKRPLVIFLPTSNFLPKSVTQSPTGSRKDSVAVEICSRFAKMGFVAASASYRLGWNPIDTSQDNRVSTLINAAYRGIQDVRSCIRFFKENHALYGIDTTKIIVWGSGTGGYLSLGAATLDKFSEIGTTTNPSLKFFKKNPAPAPPTPFVYEKIPVPGGVYYVSGDVEGKNLGRVPPGVVGPPKGGDTLCLPNNTKHSSNFQFAVNMGGACGDISWVDKNSVPTISYHVPYDLYAPYKDAVLNVVTGPNSSLPVVQVQGSFEVAKKMDSLGVNPFQGKTFVAKYDPYGPAQKAKAQYSGLFPIYGTTGNIGDSSPWNFWSETDPYHNNGKASNPDMSSAKGRRYIDTLVGYALPRIYHTLNLGTEGVVTAKVTFSVDMTGQTVSPDLCIAGDFQKEAGAAGDWAPGATKLTKVGTTNVYEVTVNLTPGKTYNYKFINDGGWNGKEEKNVGCNAGGDNRQGTVGAGDTKFPTVCYNKCFACDEFTVKLSVDMSKQATVSANGVHVAGAFQGWNPSGTRMKEAVVGSKVYSVLVPMKAGAQEYKFVNGNAWGSDEKVDDKGWCAAGKDGNRKLTISKDVETAAVCYGDCNTCAKVNTNDETFNAGLTVTPNPTAGELRLNYDFATTVSKLEVRITNMLGQAVIARDMENVLSGNVSFDMSNLTDGIYNVQITDGAKFSTKRVVLQK